jgi:hypothetical protein
VRLKKTRTRGHVLADPSVNYLERQVLLCGFALHRVQQDYGYDLIMTTYNAQGEIENGLVFFQVKATGRLPQVKGGKTIAWRLDRRDLRLWLKETYPVVLVVYDGQKDKAFWLYVQDYFTTQRSLDLFTGADRVSAHIPATQRVNRTAVQRFARFKDQVVGSFGGREGFDV